MFLSVDGYYPQIPPLIFQYYLNGKSIEDICAALKIRHNIMLDIEEVDDIIDGMLEVYEVW